MELLKQIAETVGIPAKVKDNTQLAYWCKLFDNFNFSPKEFYAMTTKNLEVREIPDLEPQYVMLQQSGVLSAKRLYMQLRRERLVFEICAAPYCRSSLAFEIVGDKDGLVAQLTATLNDAEQVYAQVKAHFPEAVLTATQNYLHARWDTNDHKPFQVIDFGLGAEFMWPLKSGKELATDPLVAVCGALEHLREREVGVFQVLFVPTRHPWAENIWRAATTGGARPKRVSDLGND